MPAAYVLRLALFLALTAAIATGTGTNTLAQAGAGERTIFVSALDPRGEPVRRAESGRFRRHGGRPAARNPAGVAGRRDHGYRGLGRQQRGRGSGHPVVTRRVEGLRRRAGGRSPDRHRRTGRSPDDSPGLHLQSNPARNGDRPPVRHGIERHDAARRDRGSIGGCAAARGDSSGARAGDHQRRRVHEPKRTRRDPRSPRGWGQPHRHRGRRTELREQSRSASAPWCSIKALAKPGGSL